MKLPMALVSLATALICVAVQAEPYSDKPLHIIVAYGPGSGGDFLARLVGSRLQKELDVSVIVENKVGAQGQIATSYVARAAPDGLVLGMGSSSTHSTATFLSRNVPYNPLKDFTAVAGLNNYTFVLLVPKDSSARDASEMVALLRGKKDISYAYGNASGRVGGAHFVSVAGLKAEEIPYKSSPDGLADLAAGRVDFMFTDWSSAKAFVDSGRVRPLAVMANDTSEVLPALPAIGKKYPGFDFVNWGGLVGPVGIPTEKVARLSEAVAHVLADPDVRQRMTAMGMEVTPLTPSGLSSLIAEQYTLWGNAIRHSGIQPD